MWSMSSAVLDRDLNMRIVKYEREGARIWQRTVEILVCRTREVPTARGPNLIGNLHNLAGGEVPANMIFTMVNGSCIWHGIPPVSVCWDEYIYSMCAQPYVISQKTTVEPGRRSSLPSLWLECWISPHLLHPAQA